MLIKWITCVVPEEWRARFSAAQQTWARLAGAAGFVVQAGGWGEHDRACILSLWVGATEYEAFMGGLHDEIFEASGQEAAYERVDTRLFDLVEMTPDLVAVLPEAKALRVMQAVDPEACTAGPLGVLSARCRNPEAADTLVVTLWRDDGPAVAGERVRVEQAWTVGAGKQTRRGV